VIRIAVKYNTCGCNNNVPEAGITDGIFEDDVGDTVGLKGGWMVGSALETTLGEGVGKTLAVIVGFRLGKDDDGADTKYIYYANNTLIAANRKKNIIDFEAQEINSKSNY